MIINVHYWWRRGGMAALKLLRPKGFRSNLSYETKLKYLGTD
jgi:hypothetical protein